MEPCTTLIESETWHHYMTYSVQSYTILKGCYVSDSKPHSIIVPREVFGYAESVADMKVPGDVED